MSIDEIQHQAGTFNARNDRKIGTAPQSQRSRRTDHARYENLLRRVDEVYTEVVNLRREHNRFITSLISQLIPILEARQRKVELSERQRQIREMRLAGRREKDIAAELGVSIATVKSCEYRARKKEQLRRDREEQARKKRL